MEGAVLAGIGLARLTRQIHSICSSPNFPYLVILLLHSCRDERIFSVEGKIREDGEPELCPCTREGREWSSALCSLGARCMYKLGAHHRVYICVGGPEFYLQRLEHLWMSSPLCLDSSPVPSLCAQSPANIKGE